MYYIPGIENLLCGSCGSIEDVLVLASRLQGCEVEEFQQMALMETVYLLLVESHFFHECRDK